jgi:hypothetical protein
MILPSIKRRIREPKNAATVTQAQYCYQHTSPFTQTTSFHRRRPLRQRPPRALSVDNASNHDEARQMVFDELDDVAAAVISDYR